MVAPCIVASCLHQARQSVAVTAHAYSNCRIGDGRWLLCSCEEGGSRSRVGLASALQETATKKSSPTLNSTSTPNYNTTTQTEQFAIRRFTISHHAAPPLDLTLLPLLFYSLHSHTLLHCLDPAVHAPPLYVPALFILWRAARTLTLACASYANTDCVLQQAGLSPLSPLSEHFVVIRNTGLPSQPIPLAHLQPTSTTNSLGSSTTLTSSTPRTPNHTVICLPTARTTQLPRRILPI